jgi:hypothetical protein
MIIVIVILGILVFINFLKVPIPLPYLRYKVSKVGTYLTPTLPSLPSR